MACKNLSKSINEFIISLFILISVIFPGDIFGLKKILFFLIIILNARLIFKSLVNIKNDLLTFFGFVFPTILFLYSIILTGNIIDSFSRSFAAYMFLLIFVVKHYEIDFEKILLRSIMLIVIATVSLVILDLIKVDDTNVGFFRNEIMYKFGLGLMGKSPTYPFYYKIFFKTSPLIVILLFKSFNDSKYIKTVLCIAALVISGTRANVLFPLFFLVLFYIFFTGKKSFIVKFGFIYTGLMTVILSYKTILDILNETFIVKGQASDIVRQGHIEGIKELILNDPWILIRGSGMGSEFYSYGLEGLTSSIEWSYIDLWRQMGFIFFFVFLIFALIPVFYHNKAGVYKKIAYISYLVIAATNPLLFSSTSYMFFIYMYYDLQKKPVSLNKRGEEDETGKYSIGDLQT